jgi:hypothetical protein
MIFRRKKGSKYKNVKIGGYDSKRECKRAAELKLLLKAGEISDLQEQIKFNLQPKFRNNQGVAIREINYIADFYYFDIAKKAWIVEDSKGFRTPDFKLKAKMFQYKNPDLIFIES